MRTPILLKRKEGAVVFTDERGGQYLNPKIQVYNTKEHIHGKSLVLEFGFYPTQEAEEPTLKFSLVFDSHSIEVMMNEEGTEVVEWGYPTYNYLMENLIDFDENGNAFLVSEEGISWLANTPYCFINNSLGELNLSNWKFEINETA